MIIGFEITILTGLRLVQSRPEELSNEIRPPVRPALAIQSEPEEKQQKLFHPLLKVFSFSKSL